MVSNCVYVLHGQPRSVADCVQDKNPLLALPITAAVQEISVNHAMANTRGGRRMYEGVGDTNDMQAVSCGDECLWNLGTKIAMDDIHMSIELSQLGSWIDDVKQLVNSDLHGAGKIGSKRRMLPPGYFWFRFGRGSNDMLGHTSGLAAPVQVQVSTCSSIVRPPLGPHRGGRLNQTCGVACWVMHFSPSLASPPLLLLMLQASFMKSMHNPLQPGKFAWVLEVLEQLTLCKYDDIASALSA